MSAFLEGRGVINVEGVEFRLEPLKVADSHFLYHELAKIGSKLKGAEDYQILAPMLEVMSPLDRQTAIAQLTKERLDSESQLVYRGRRDKEGAALELFYRASKADKELTLAKCKALVNDANAIEVAKKMSDIDAVEKSPGN